jgi:hypothetical protein
VGKRFAADCVNSETVEGNSSETGGSLSCGFFIGTPGGTPGGTGICIPRPKGYSIIWQENEKKYVLPF